MHPILRRVLGALLLAVATVPQAADKPDGASADRQLTRAQALQAVTDPRPETRRRAVERLAEVGTMADAGRLVSRLRDDDAGVRALAAAALWEIWSRSGDAEVDALFRQGLRQMQAANLGAALATFSEIIRRKPEFAEGWNKRATILFLAGEHGKSLKDCDEVLKRNPNHFGALSGMAQIHILLGHPEEALAAYERAVRINPNLPDAEENLKALRDAVNAKKARTV